MISPDLDKFELLLIVEKGSQGQAPHRRNTVTDVHFQGSSLDAASFFSSPSPDLQWSTDSRQ
jgi:hypothetical protein